MGFTRNLLYLSVFVVLGGVLLNKYSPQYTSTLIESPLVKHALDKFKKYSSLIYPVTVEKKSTRKSDEKLFTADELRKYTGKEGEDGLYLSFLGNVYDVEKGRQYYGPNSSYHFFAGRDATRAFVTGEFKEEGLIDDIANLAPSEYLAILEWDNLYKRDYKAVGKLIGIYYDENGDPTEYRKDADDWFKEAIERRGLEEREKFQFPPCNSEYNMDIGSRVYCSDGSGGMERGWGGVPRRLFILGSTRERCACVKNFGKSALSPKTETSEKEDEKTGRGDLDHPNLKEYPNCEPDADSCYLKKFTDS